MGIRKELCILMGNVDLLKRTLDQIVKFPEKHSQDTWHCETTMCIAGHAAVLAGAKLKVGYHGNTELWHDGMFVSASRFADEALDLTDFEYNYLFFCMDDDTAIRRMKQIIALWEEKGSVYHLEDEDYIEIPGGLCGCGCED